MKNKGIEREYLTEILDVVEHQIKEAETHHQFAAIFSALETTMIMFCASTGLGAPLLIHHRDKSIPVMLKHCKEIMKEQKECTH